MSEPLRLGVAGLGTVGAGLLDLIETHGSRLSESLGREIKITAVSARERSKGRGVDLGAFKWFDDAAKMAADPAIDVLVELHGRAVALPRRPSKRRSAPRNT